MELEAYVIAVRVSLPLSPVTDVLVIRIRGADVGKVMSELETIAVTLLRTTDVGVVVELIDAIGVVIASDEGCGATIDVMIGIATLDDVVLRTVVIGVIVIDGAKVAGTVAIVSIMVSGTLNVEAAVDEEP